MGDNVIHYLGHVKMMAAVQPFICGAISKCVTGETLLPTEDGLTRIGSLHRGEAPDTFRSGAFRLASLEGEQKTDAFYYGGKRPVRKVVLRSGHTVAGTHNHRLLTATDGGFDWKQLDELEPGDMVAVQYAADLWSQLPARFDDFVPTPAVRIAEDGPAAGGDDRRSGLLTRSVCSRGSYQPLELDDQHHELGTRGPSSDSSSSGASCLVSSRSLPRAAIGAHRSWWRSKSIVEFFDYLRIGTHASSKRIPDAVLQSPRSMVLAFVQGLSLDAYVSVTSMPKWAICLDSGGLLDDLQAVLTNLGIVHGRISKWNKKYNKSYDEVYATGRHAQLLTFLVPFAEPDKAEKAWHLCERPISDRHNGWDVVPGISPHDLYDALPYGERNREGGLVRTEFAFLCDPTHKVREPSDSRARVVRAWREAASVVGHWSSLTACTSRRSSRSPMPESVRSSMSRYL